MGANDAGKMYQCLRSAAEAADSPHFAIWSDEANGCRLASNP